MRRDEDKSLALDGSITARGMGTEVTPTLSGLIAHSVRHVKSVGYTDLADMSISKKRGVFAYEKGNVGSRPAADG